MVVVFVVAVAVGARALVGRHLMPLMLLGQRGGAWSLSWSGRVYSTCGRVW